MVLHKPPLCSYRASIRVRVRERDCAQNCREHAHLPLAEHGLTCLIAPQPQDVPVGSRLVPCRQAKKQVERCVGDAWGNPALRACLKQAWTGGFDRLVRRQHASAGKGMACLACCGRACHQQQPTSRAGKATSNGHVGQVAIGSCEDCDRQRQWNEEGGQVGV